MDRPRVFVTRRIPEPGLDVLRPACDGLVAMLADRVDAAPLLRP
jgi:hypothetical protein